MQPASIISVSPPSLPAATAVPGDAGGFQEALTQAESVAAPLRSSTRVVPATASQSAGITVPAPDGAAGAAPVLAASEKALLYQGRKPAAPAAPGAMPPAPMRDKTTGPAMVAVVIPGSQTLPAGPDVAVPPSGPRSAMAVAPSPPANARPNTVLPPGAPAHAPRAAAGAAELTQQSDAALQPTAPPPATTLSVAPLSAITPSATTPSATTLGSHAAALPAAVQVTPLPAMPALAAVPATPPSAATSVKPATTPAVHAVSPGTAHAVAVSPSAAAGKPGEGDAAVMAAARPAAKDDRALLRPAPPPMQAGLAAFAVHDAVHDSGQTRAPSQAAASAVASATAPVTQSSAAGLAAAVTAMHQAGQSGTVLKLDPPGLGNLAVHVALGQSGLLNVTFLPTTQAASTMLQNNLSGLGPALAQSGIMLGQAQVGGQFNQNAGQGAYQPPSAMAEPPQTPRGDVELPASSGVSVYA